MNTKSNKRWISLFLVCALMLGYFIIPSTISHAATPAEKIHMPVLNPPKNGDTVITGYTDPGVDVTLTIGGTSYTGQAGTDGKFSITVPTLTVGAEIQAKATKKARIVKWQSMWLPMKRRLKEALEIPLLSTDPIPPMAA